MVAAVVGSPGSIRKSSKIGNSSSDAAEAAMARAIAAAITRAMAI